MSLPSLTDIQQLLSRIPPCETPFLLLDEQRLRTNARNFRAALKNGQVYFSVKANNDPRVLGILFEEGISFDVASWGEISRLIQLGVPAERLIYNAPTKLPRDIARAFDAGVKTYAFDSAIEIEKIAQLAPGSQVIARISVDNLGSAWPLERKFGMDAAQTVDGMLYARRLGLNPYGLTFHVGSQNSDPSAWERAIQQASRIWQQLAENGIQLQVLDAGGGFPVEFHEPVPDVFEIAQVILAAVHRWLGPEVKLFVEPGRGLVGDTAIMVTTVINRAIRGNQTWLYLDSGVFHGLIEGMEMFGFKYPVMAEKDGLPVQSYTLSGPTCDSADIIGQGVMLPEGLSLGDRLFVLTAGAYTNSLQWYNGIDFPELLVVSGEKSA